jgi:acyl-CoA thioesterase I
VSPRSLRIVALGDSTTAGTPGFRSPIESPPDGEGNPESQYAYWVRRLHPEWTVLNRGVNGERSDEILRRLERDALDEHPEYVVVLAGVNDIFQGFPVDSVTANLTEMYRRIQDAKLCLVTATVLPFNSMSRAQAAGIQRVNQWIRESAQSGGHLFCDTYQLVIDPRAPTRLRSSPDGLHPDVDGYRRVGEGIAEVIQSAEATSGARTDQGR